MTVVIFELMAGEQMGPLVRSIIFASARAMLLVATADAVMAKTTKIQPKADTMDTNQIKADLEGEWRSIAPEVRPSASKNADGSLKPFYLTRVFKYLSSDRFELEIVNFADPFGTVPLARIKIGGHMQWRGAHAIAPGAQKVDFIADEAYSVEPMAQGFADVLNKVATSGYGAWTVGVQQSIFGKSFIPFGLKEGENFREYDLVFLNGDFLFWGARNIDGRGFDTEQNRPTNLQIPLMRK